MNTDNTTHTTTSELKFLDGIGLYLDDKSQSRRKKALKGYIESAKSRVNWDGIDGALCLAYAAKQLAAIK